MIEDLRIYCDHKSHPSKTVAIERMVHDARGWMGMGSVTTEARLQAEAEARRRGLRRVLPKRTETGYRPTADNHEKFNFRCQLCGLEVRTTASRLATFLDALASADVDKVSLSALAARLG